MIIKTRNILADSAPKTYLTFAEISGTNVLRWNNPNGFQSSWAIQVGETGEEQTEIVLLSSSTPAGTAGTLTANTLYAHPANTPIYAIKFDQVVFERSTSGTTGTAAPMTGGTITLQPDNLFTQFDDTSGSTSYGYRTYFRNSVLAVNSTESDWIVYPGFSTYSLAALRDRARGRVWNGKYLTDDTLNDWINEWNDEMTNAAIEVNEDYAMGTADIPFGTSGLGTITNSDFKQVKRVWITYNGSDFFKSRKMDSNVFMPDQQFNSSMPGHYYQGDTILGVKPEQSGGTARIEYYKRNVRLVNDADELPVPMRGYTKSYIDYLENLALRKDGKYTEAQGPLAEAVRGKQQFKQELTPRDKTGQDYVDIKEAVQGDDYYPF